MSLRTLGVGGNGLVWSGGGNDAAEVRFKGELTRTEMEVDASEQIAALEVDATLIRIAMEASRTRSLAGGGTLSPSFSLGARHDGGDGNTGTGAEIGGGVRYANAQSGVSASASAHALIGRSDYEEWGIQGTVRLASGADGQGLSFVMRPGYGDASNGDGNGNTGRIWSNGLRDTPAASRPNASGRLEMRLGYGLSSAGERDGLLTPWGGLALQNDGNRYQMGLDWASGGPFTPAPLWRTPGAWQRGCRSHRVVEGRGAILSVMATSGGRRAMPATRAANPLPKAAIPQSAAALFFHALHRRRTLI